MIIAVGGWIPFVIATHTGQSTDFIDVMPMTVGIVQQVGMIGLLVSVLVFRRSCRRGRFTSLRCAA